MRQSEFRFVTNSVHKVLCVAVLLSIAIVKHGRPQVTQRIDAARATTAALVAERS
jgi:hypothetical protein